MRHIETLFAVTPTAALRLLLALLDVSSAFDRVRRLVAIELLFRNAVAEDLAHEAGASFWGIAPVGVA